MSIVRLKKGGKRFEVLNKNIVVYWPHSFYTHSFSNLRLHVTRIKCKNGGMGCKSRPSLIINRLMYVANKLMMKNIQGDRFGRSDANS